MHRSTIDHFAGLLLGGAIGDALGAPIEFHSREKIMMQFGTAGVRSYVEQESPGSFTDDTQMTLFTLEGLFASYDAFFNDEAVIKQIYYSYLRWLHTQGIDLPFGMESVTEKEGLLLAQEELFQPRAAGNTVISALRGGRMASTQYRINNSKGCGGIMRVAPVGMVCAADAERAFHLGCESAALTHSHPSGYLSAGFFAALVAHLVGGCSLAEAIGEATELLKEHEDHQETLEAVNAATNLAERTLPPEKALEQIGGGWVGEESLGIALFCALRHPEDFEAGVALGINHAGDSDSTGALAGQLLGLLLGEEAIPQAWLEGLQQRPLLEMLAEDVWHFTQGSFAHDLENWADKYPDQSLELD